ncbi:MAG: L,D-transpeptidase family protein [Bacteroidetes bacterium]|nr:L,D-transpeptidase family protein [Bacteroidota bacterium]
MIISIEGGDAQNAENFKEKQMKYERVKNAFREKEKTVNEMLAAKNLSAVRLEIFVRIFKTEKKVEVWGKNREDSVFIPLTDYDICTSSGSVGPKRKQGDGQVPEGFYHIERFNPVSNFHLSLGINYPDKSDRILGGGGNLGGDIFIHGNCVSIGCIPITDDKIKELYILAVESRNNGQEKIPVHIFPCRMDGSEFEGLKKEYATYNKLLEFWQNVKEGWDYFENGKKVPIVSVDGSGKYKFRP